MGRGDVAVKQWIGDKKRFADLFNGIVFRGKQIVLPEELEPIPGESSILVSDQKRTEKSVQKYRDIVMRWKQGTQLAVLACENQEQVHYAMAVRNMLYDSLTYAEQVRLTGKANEEAGMKVAGAEFLSGFRREDRLYPVITLVFYYDLKAWDGSLDLYGMFHLEEWETEKDALQSYVPNYRINLVDAGNVGDVERFQTDLQEVFGLLKCRGQQEELQKYMYEHEEYFRNIDQESYRAVREFLHSEKLLKANVKSEEEKETVDMCKALDDLYNSGIERGIECGIQALIEAFQELGKVKAEAAAKVEEKFSVTIEVANTYVEKYWK